jgi:hypothetical protein
MAAGRRRAQLKPAKTRKPSVIATMKALSATLAEIVATTGWQKHTVRGFVSILGSKGGEKRESSKNAASAATGSSRSPFPSNGASGFRPGRGYILIRGAGVTSRIVTSRVQSHSRREIVPGQSYLQRTWCSRDRRRVPRRCALAMLPAIQPFMGWCHRASSLLGCMKKW